MLKQRRKRFEKFTKVNNLSELARSVAKASYEYDYYSRFELYALEQCKSNVSERELPPSFFRYREEVIFNDDYLKRLPSYNRFLSYYVDNKLQNSCDKIRNVSNLQATVSEIRLIDSIIDHEYIKNNLLRRVIGNFLLSSKDEEKSKRVLQEYLDKNTNHRFEDEMIRLAKATIRLLPGNTIPEQELINSNGEITWLSSLFNKPVTVLYFWSTDNKEHYVKAHRRAAFLRETYPNIDIVGINIDDKETKNWLKTIKRNRYNLMHEYEFKNPESAYKELVIYFRNKAILVDDENKILNPNANLFSLDLATELDQILEVSASSEK